MGVAVVEGRFGYAANGKSLSDGYAKTDAYINDKSESGARFRGMGRREFIPAKSSSHTAQLQSIRAIVTVISYIMWNFRIMDVSRSFLKPIPLERKNFRETSTLIRTDFSYEVGSIKATLRVGYSL